MNRLAVTWSCALVLTIGGCVDGGAEEIDSIASAVTTTVEPHVIDCAAEYANHGGIAAEQRVVSWKYNNFQASGGAEDLACTYGWCGPNSSIAGTRAGCVSGDDLETAYGYQFGACNSSAWGQRFRASLKQLPGGVDPDYCGDSSDPARCTGTTTFGYHPYWEIDYNGSRRTYQGWSYVQHASDTASYTTSGGTTSCPDAGVATTTGLNLTVSEANGADQYFQMVVPAGSFNTTVRTTGASGDADLVVRWDQPPTTSTYGNDCKSDAGGNADEVCTVHGSGTLHVLVTRYSSYGSLTLTGTYQAFSGTGGGGGGGGCTPDCSGDACGQGDGCGGTCPATDAGTCGMCGNAACGGGGSCDSIAYSASGTNGASYSDPDTVRQVVSLTAGVSYTFSTCGTTTTDTYLRLHRDGVQQAANDDGCGSGYQSSFTYTPSASGDYELSMGCYGNSSCSATVNISPAADSCGGGGTCTPDCSGDSCGQDDGCGGTCPDTDASTCGMCGNAACGGGSCTSLDESGLSGSSGTELRYTISGTDVSTALAGGSGDADLYVRLGSAPTTSSYDCRSNGYSNNESCAVSGTGTFHILVRGYSSFSGATLTADVASCN